MNLTFALIFAVLTIIGFGSFLEMFSRWLSTGDFIYFPFAGIMLAIAIGCGAATIHHIKEIKENGI